MSHRRAVPSSRNLWPLFSLRHSYFAMLLILLLTAWLRLYRLPALPPGLNFDEAGSGVAGLDILQGHLRLWWPLGGGQEPFWPYLVALTTAILGNVPLALRLPAAWAGILTVAAAYRLGRALPLARSGPERCWLALLAALGLAMSGWHLHFSRLGFRAILLPLFSALAFYFLWRSLAKSREIEDRGLEMRSLLPAPGTGSAASLHLSAVCLARPAPHLLLAGRHRSLVYAALFVALAVYSYLAARLLFLVPVLFWAVQWLAGRLSRLSGADREPLASRPAGAFSSFWPLLYFLLALALFLGPLLFYFSLYPAALTARAATVSIFNPAWNGGGLVGTAWRTLDATLGTFAGGRGDANPLVNLPGRPALPPLLAVFFAVGLLVSLARAARTLRRAPVTPSPHLFLLIWWLVMLLPALLAPEGAPHHLRLLGAMVPAYLLIAVGIGATGQVLIHRAGRLAPDVTVLFPLALYALVAGQTYTAYFQRWPATVDLTLPFDRYAVRLAGEMAQAPANVGYVLPMDIRAGAEARHYTLDYLLAGRPAAYTYVPVGEAQAAARLNSAAEGKSELRVVRWTDDKHREADAKEIVTFLLATSARLVERRSFPVYDLEIYALPERGPASRPLFALPAISQPVNILFEGQLRLEAVSIPPATTPGAELPLALALAPAGPMSADYKVSLRLLDPAGRRLAQKDRLLLHDFHQGTSLWPPGTVHEYYLLAVPPDTPPGDTTVALVVYHADTQAPLVVNGQVEVPLGRVKVE